MSVGFAGVTASVAVGAPLTRVKVSGTVVAGVAHTVVIAIGPVRIGNPPTVVTDIASTIGIAVGLVDVLDVGTVVARVAEAVLVVVTLNPSVSHSGSVGTEVARVAGSVVVTIDLGDVELAWAVVDDIADHVTVGIEEIRTCSDGTAVAGIASVIRVTVGL